MKILARLENYFATADTRGMQLREQNIAAARAHVAEEIRYWTEQAKVATPNSDRWHDCMDELDSVQALARCT